MLILLGILLVVLKLSGVIAWPWLAVLLPIYVIPVFVIVLLILAAIAGVFVSVFESMLK